MAEITSARLLDGSTAQTLRVRVDHAVRGLHITRSIMQSGRLSSVHEREEEYRLYRTKAGRSILTADNPLLDARERENLDDAGLIRVGVVVEDQTILASILQTAEMDIGRPPPAVGMVRAGDDSLRTPSGWDGAVVTAARYESHVPSGVEPPKNQIGRISIHLRLVLPICVGDVLLLRDVPFVIAGLSESTNAEIIADASVGRLLELSDGQSAEVTASIGSPPGRWVTAARSTGPYSLITQRPLKLSLSKASQPVAPAHVHVLSASGMSANLAELVTLKSDDVAGREQLDLALRNEGEFPVPGTPETFRALLAEFTALGLKPKLHARASFSEVSLEAMSDVDRITCSAGSISRPETINFKTLKPVPHGILCEETFGPEASPERRTRFGHFELPDPIVPWVFRVPMPDGGPSILSRVLKIGDDQITGLLDHELWLNEYGDIVGGRAPGPGQLAGPLAIERLLHALPDEALPAWLRASAEPRSVLVARTILLLPPDLRPLILLHNGNFATSDLNDHYRRVINRANRLRKLKELNAPEPIVSNELRMLQRTTDCLFANTFFPEAKQVPGGNGQPLKDLLNIALVRLQTDEGKRTDYSAAARAVPLSDAEPNTIVLPQLIAKTLKLRPRMPVLATRAPSPTGFTTPVLPLRTAIHDHAVIGLHPDSYDALFTNSAGAAECIVHRPMTPPAIEEALARIGKVQSATTRPPASWMEESDLSVLLGRLLEAVSSATRLSFDSPAGILLAGSGSAKFSTTDPPRSVLRSGSNPMERELIEIPITWDEAS